MIRRAGAGTAVGEGTPCPCRNELARQVGAAPRALRLAASFRSRRLCFCPASRRAPRRPLRHRRGRRRAGRPFARHAVWCFSPTLTGAAASGRPPALAAARSRSLRRRNRASAPAGRARPRLSRRRDAIRRGLGRRARRAGDRGRRDSGRSTPRRPPRRVLGFGAWLPPDQAAGAGAHVALLRERGQSFRQDLVSQAAAISKPRAGPSAAGWSCACATCPATGSNWCGCAKSSAEQTAQLENLRGLLDLSAHPVWTRGPDQKLDWVNAAYAQAVDAESPAATRWRAASNCSTAQAREAAARAREGGEVWRQRRACGGRRRAPPDGGARRPAAGRRRRAWPTDLSELEALRADHARQMEFAYPHARPARHRRSPSSTVSKRLVFANAAYRQLWSLDPAFLDQRPIDSRNSRPAARRAPPARTGRLPRLEERPARASISRSEPAPQVWHLPDGRTLRVAFDPNPQGGITYLFDDVTERFTLESQYNALARVQSETLDALQEGVAVFGADGRLKLFNPAFARIWRLSIELHRPSSRISTRWRGLQAAAARRRRLGRSALGGRGPA